MCEGTGVSASKQEPTLVKIQPRFQPFFTKEKKSRAGLNESRQCQPKLVRVDSFWTVHHSCFEKQKDEEERREGSSSFMLFRFVQ